MGYSEREYQKIRKEGPWVVISINETSEVPIYQQIRNQIVLGIIRWKIKAGRAASHRTGISRRNRNQFHDGE